MRTIRCICFLSLLVAVTAWTGCGYPQAEPENIHLITSLRTALSAEKTEWLDQNVAAIEERHASGEMSDESYEAFQSIIQTARDGDWEKAERIAISFQKSQRPPR